MCSNEAPNPEATDPADELERTLSETQSLGEKLAEQGRDLTEVGQNLTDWAGATRDAATYLTSPQTMKSLNAEWSNSKRHAEVLLGRLSDIDLSAFTSTSGTAAFATVSAFDPNRIIPSVRPEARPAAQQVAERIQKMAARSAEATSVITLLRSFGLDAAPAGTRSPLQQLRTAHEAFENPVSADNPASTSLIPMRECILSAIGRLLAQRPQQHKAKSTYEQIVSIGAQLGRGTVPPELFKTLASQCTELLDKDLSPAKQRALSRAEWERVLIMATLWLKNFLGSLDPSKLRLPPVA